MSLYYFKIVDGTVLRDPSGLDCHDDQVAIAAARVTADEMAADARVQHTRRIEIEDEAGRQKRLLLARDLLRWLRNRRRSRGLICERGSTDT